MWLWTLNTRGSSVHQWQPSTGKCTVFHSVYMWYACDVQLIPLSYSNWESLFWSSFTDFQRMTIWRDMSRWGMACTSYPYNWTVVLYRTSMLHCSRFMYSAEIECLSLDLFYSLFCFLADDTLHHVCSSGDWERGECACVSENYYRTAQALQASFQWRGKYSVES